MKVKPLFLVSVNTCTVTLCDTNDWWSDVSGIFLFFISFFGFNKVKNTLKLTERQLGWHVNKIIKLWNCVKHWNDCRSVEMCGVWWSVTVNELKQKKKTKKKHNVQSTAVPTGTWLTSGASITNPVRALTITFFVLCFHILKCYFLTVW